MFYLLVFIDKQVPTEMADAWARAQGMLFLEASAKTRLGIRQVFMEVVKKMLENPQSKSIRPTALMTLSAISEIVADNSCALTQLYTTLHRVNRVCNCNTTRPQGQIAHWTMTTVDVAEKG